jgi:superfamily I DNA/RNA helicase
MLSALNPEQRLAVETTGGPVLVLAGAGTGKTRVITTRIAYLIARGVAPRHILAVTFTNKAAREMFARVHQLLPRGARAPGADPNDRPTLCTFHSLCVRILRQHIEKLGYKRNFVIYDESDQLGVMRKILSQVSARNEETDPASVLAQLSRQRNGGSRAGALGNPSAAAMAEHVRPRYESALRACNAVDFDDLILLALRVFREHPEALALCRDRYRYVMVDEYQDTNAAQFELVRALTSEHRNLCVVGDDDQSIYGWRGAEIANLLDLEKHFPEVKVIKLEQNYRSTNTILQAANALIHHNARRHAKRLWSQHGAGSKILRFICADEEEEARTVVEEVEFARMARRVAWAAQAVLFRTNQQSRPLETALRKAGIRYHVVGGQSFFDRREVRDFLAYLKVCVNPDDDASLLRIANVPARGLSDATMQRLLGASQERKCSVYVAMKHPLVQADLPARTQASLHRFVTVLEQARAPLHAPLAPGAAPTSLAAWADGLLAGIGYLEELRRTEKNTEAAENRVRNLRELVGSLDDAGTPGTPLAARLEQFLDDVALEGEREAEEAGPGDAVTLITMHSCKGLEFPHVFIVGLEEGLLPHARSTSEGTLDEERRLFYVALTRARQTLRLSWCRARRKYGQLTPCHPSRFLQELPVELVEDAADQAATPVTPAEGHAWFAALRSQLAEP